MHKRKPNRAKSKELVRTERHGNHVELRLKEGELDEIILNDPTTSKCLLHLEAMYDECFSIGIYYSTQKRLDIDLRSTTKIKAKVRL